MLRELKLFIISCFTVKNTSKYKTASHKGQCSKIFKTLLIYI